MKSPRPDVRHVVFDWSGTLYDDHVPSFAATRETVAYFSGKKITRAEYKKHFTIPVDRFYRRYTRRHAIAEIDRRYFEVFARRIGEGKLFDGVRETLELLRERGIGASVFSTVRQDLLDGLCRKLKLDGFFTRVHGSVFDKVKAMRGHLEESGLKPGRTLFIGDMAHDVAAANARGVLSGAVLSGYHDAERLVAERPRFLWNHPRDWPPFFDALTRRPAAKEAKPHAVATAGALVVNPAGEALIVLTPKWGFTYGIPGGKIERGETARAAVIRELREETGLKIRPGELFLAMDCIDSAEFHVPRSHFLLLNYVATTRSRRVTLNDEAVSYLWVRPERALRLALNTPTRKLIEAYLREKKPAAVLATGPV